MKCPGCGEEMQTVREPDVSTDKCPRCGGVFLDKGELNTLATGMAGDIEFCSVEDGRGSPDRFASRKCPKCRVASGSSPEATRRGSDTFMDKVDLLCYSDVVFDHCPECRGFFVDLGELEAMNEELAETASKEHGEELRTCRDGHLVTIDLLAGVGSAAGAGSAVGFAAPVGTTSVRIAVHFEAPLGIGLRVYGEGWVVKLAKAFGLYRKQDIATGNGDFDGKFVVQAADPDKAQRVLSPRVQEALLKFLADEPKLARQPGAIQVLDSRIVYTEGPYAGEVKTDIVGASTGIVDRLLAIAHMMETQ